MRKKAVPVTLGLAALACTGSTDPRPGPPEDRGRLLTSGIFVSDMYWSADGSELLFLGDGTHVMAVPVAGGSPRTLYSSAQSLRSLRVAPNNIYVTVTKSSGGFVLVRVPRAGGTPDTVLNWPGSLHTYAFALSADERFVTLGDTLFDLANATRRGLPHGTAWSFSSDGGSLLWAPIQLTAFELSIISTSSMASQTLPRPVGLVRHHTDEGVHFWAANDPHILHVPFTSGSPVKVFLMNGRTRANREVASLAAEPIASHGFDFYVADISADGARAVLWTGPGWTQLHSIVTATGSYAVRATVSRDSTLVTEVRLSPDGRKAAYVMYDAHSLGVSGVPKMYIVDVAP